MNVLSMLQLKKNVVVIDADSSIRQAIEKSRYHSYTALPVLDDQGRYVGTVSEGDFLDAVLSVKDCDVRNLEDIQVSAIIREGFNPAASVDVDIQTLLQMVTNQNFVPIVDDRNVFMGIITRKSIIEELMKLTQHMEYPYRTIQSLPELHL